jgi:hypothetical protein
MKLRGTGIPSYSIVRETGPVQPPFEVYRFTTRAVSEPRFPELLLYVSVPIVVHTRTDFLPCDERASELEVST